MAQTSNANSGTLLEATNCRLMGPTVNDPSATRILIVEDDLLTALNCRLALEDAGFTVIGIAPTAEIAITMVQQQRPDLILMDNQLGGDRTGVDVAGEIYRTLGTAILFLTANVDPATQRHGESAKPLGWVSKPYSADEVICAIRSNLSAIHSSPRC